MRSYQKKRPQAENEEETTSLNDRVGSTSRLQLAIVLPGAYVEWSGSGGQNTALSHLWEVRRRFSVRTAEFGEDASDKEFGENKTPRYSDDMFTHMKMEIAAEKAAREFIAQKIKEDSAEWARAPYQLVSFEGKGQAELIRLVLIVAGQKYEDVRVAEDEWEEMKDTTPYGALPILVKCNVKWGEASAIVRTLAKKFLLLGSTNDDHLITEATFERLRRLQLDHKKAIKWATSGEKNKERLEWAKSQLTHVILPEAFKEWEAQILSSPGPFIITNGMTVADIAIMDFVDQCSTNLVITPILADFPAVSDLLTLVRRNPRLQAYLDGRAVK
ncbi:glutathione S-transferase class-mu 28 kDa isozyme isoform X2 [Aplysia californica]|uniref:Glutathione S-transferase class-mu 28 kDa isozyme isoform X2 n=1 Tax=Aplysia californica TaxID=6500 RepID=A0ABM1A0D7_APLCA|nr:glutathione S-transferase class-mu 28 kDa isozyme isoform X2 [Aplysia californica]